MQRREAEQQRQRHRPCRVRQGKGQRDAEVDRDRRCADDPAIESISQQPRDGGQEHERDELRQAEANVAGLRQHQSELEAQQKAIEAERDTLLGALAAAVPQLKDGGDRIGVALARIDCLKAQVTKATPTVTVATVAEEETRIPSEELMSLIAAGGRQFTQAQREWCVGEAMVLSGFQYTPMELIEQGDASIAKIITGARNKH